MCGGSCEFDKLIKGAWSPRDIKLLKRNTMLSQKSPYDKAKVAFIMRE